MSPYRSTARTLLVALIAVSLVAPPFFLAAVPKAEAQTGWIGCLAGYAAQVGAAIGIGGGTAAATAGIATQTAAATGLFVPTATWVAGDTSPTSLTTSAASAALTWKECVLDALLWAAKNIIIPTLTASIVQWINSGFDGLPTVLSNPQSFMLDMADAMAGEFIWEAGLGALCSPFQLQVQIDLALSYFGPSSDSTLHCNISDVYNNTADAMAQFQNFLSGSFQSGGFPAWFNLSMQPHNNPYGSFLNAQAEMGIRIRNKQGAELNILSWGDGFQSIRNADGSITTPGQYISRELEDWTGAPLAQLEVADEIDEILGALFQQLVATLLQEGVTQVSAPQNNGPSYLDRIRAEATEGGALSLNAILARIEVLIAKETAAGFTQYLAELNQLKSEVQALQATDPNYASKLGALLSRVTAIESEIAARDSMPSASNPTPPPPPPPPGTPDGGTAGGGGTTPPPPPPPADTGGDTPTTPPPADTGGDTPLPPPPPAIG